MSIQVFADDIIITLAASDANDCQQSINTMQKLWIGPKLCHSKLANADHGLDDFFEMVKKPNSQTSK